MRLSVVFIFMLTALAAIIGAVAVPKNDATVTSVATSITTYGGALVNGVFHPTSDVGEGLPALSLPTHTGKAPNNRDAVVADVVAAGFPSATVPTNSNPVNSNSAPISLMDNDSVINDTVTKHDAKLTDDDPTCYPATDETRVLFRALDRIPVSTIANTTPTTIPAAGAVAQDASQCAEPGILATASVRANRVCDVFLCRLARQIELTLYIIFFVTTPPVIFMCYRAFKPLEINSALR
ncbi:hypothetical protein K490DRAFT_57419 [Saccharata proteae CBS 121410]|uniref:Uncharacterized protein n=1 Tax=Saccharata proteae CBS 121410 TaxID=1314787 RepID=A0A9P4HUX9_9PEZI|nr:hypothetical protein K490DRAFT_57419 [Saccharata proteae CBS 121410]